MAGDVWLLPLAGQSNGSGRQEVYVQPFREGSGAGNVGIWQVSTNGGIDLQWRRDGKELFYLAPDRKLMAVEVKTGATFAAGSPKALFTMRALFTFVVFTVSTPSSYAVSADGQCFLIPPSKKPLPHRFRWW